MTFPHWRLILLEAILGQPEGAFFLGKVVEGTFTLPLLLVGDEGTGRRMSVIEAAKLVFEPDQHAALENGRHPDFRLLEPEGDKEIKVDAVRALVEETETLPSWGRWKFFVIDGADRITAAGANALLKVLEEPPSKVRFFLLCEQIDLVIPTIRSRCAVVSYRRIAEEIILAKLRAYTEDETKALVCARNAEGSLGRAIRCLVSGQLTMRDEMLGLLSVTSRKDLFAAFSAVNDIVDLSQALGFLGKVLRDLVVLDTAPSSIINVDVLATLKQLKAQLSADVIRGLLAELRLIRERGQSPINTTFHLKAALAAACS